MYRAYDPYNHLVYGTNATGVGDKHNRNPALGHPGYVARSVLVGDFRTRLKFGNGDLHNGLGTRCGLFLHGRSTGRPPGNQTLCRAISVEGRYVRAWVSSYQERQ